MSVATEINSVSGLDLYDAHNHLQDERLDEAREEITAIVARENIRKMVVNGSCESDWPAVLALSRKHPQVLPSFGYHPWHVRERSGHWAETLEKFLDETPSAVGEIGLDRWIKDFDTPAQEEVFTVQMRIAAERNLPVSIHCLKAWGRLLELLKDGPLPRCGFLLHSFGGPREMIPSLAKLGAYFSLPGYFAHERKARQREAFREVPRERLLLETDAPDQLLPPERERYQLAREGKALNHPGNLAAVYEFAAELRGETPQDLSRQIASNFQRLFGAVSPS